MEYFLYAIFFTSCLVLILAVLLQPGKTDAGALFTSNVSSTAFSPRGTATVLSKVTIAAAATFMISALLLSMPALTGNISVLNANPESATESTVPENSVEGNSNTADGNANSAGDTNSNAAAEANSNTSGGASNTNTEQPASNAPAANANSAPSSNN